LPSCLRREKRQINQDQASLAGMALDAKGGFKQVDIRLDRAETKAPGNPVLNHTYAIVFHNYVQCVVVQYNLDPQLCGPCVLDYILCELLTYSVHMNFHLLRKSRVQTKNLQIHIQLS